MALKVKKIPMGIKTNVDNHIPIKGLAELDFTNFSPNVLNKWKTTKKMMANTKGVPNPPFRIMDPKGAPIKNNTRQATESVNFRCHSISCNRNEVIFEV